MLALSSLLIASLVEDKWKSFGLAALVGLLIVGAQTYVIATVILPGDADVLNLAAQKLAGWLFIVPMFWGLGRLLDWLYRRMRSRRRTAHPAEGASNLQKGDAVATPSAAADFMPNPLPAPPPLPSRRNIEQLSDNGRERIRRSPGELANFLWLLSFIVGGWVLLFYARQYSSTLLNLETATANQIIAEHSKDLEVGELTLFGYRMTVGRMTGGKVIRYLYRGQMDLKSVKKDDFRSRIRKYLEDECERNAVQKFNLSNGFRYIYSYDDKDGAFLAVFRVTENCKVTNL